RSLLAPWQNPSILPAQSPSFRRLFHRLRRALSSVAHSYLFRPTDAAQTAHARIRAAQRSPPFLRALQLQAPALSPNSLQLPQTLSQPLSLHPARPLSPAQFSLLRAPPPARLALLRS